MPELTVVERRQSSRSVVGRAAACANCAAPLTGEYCAHCGQRDRDLQRPFSHLLSEVADHAFSIDTKLVRTIVPLLFRPGEVTRSYLAGRRVTYLPPLRSYLIAALIFFGLFSIFPSDLGEVLVYKRGSAEASASRGPGNRTTFELPATLPYFDAAYQQRFARAQREPEAFARAAYGTIPRLFFLFLPMFALFLELFYRKQGFYFEHLVFSLYYHAFAFLSFGALFLIGRSDLPGSIATPLRIVVIAWLLAYLPVALRRVYGGSWPKTLLKLVGLGFLYLVGAGGIGMPLMAAAAFFLF